jgi:putative ATP-binding cassette transporter
MTDARTIYASPKDYKVTRELLARLWRLAKPFWAQKKHWPWWILAVVLLVTPPSMSWLYYKLAHINADMTNAIIAKERAKYISLFWYTTAVGMGIWLVQAVMNYLQNLLYIRWRWWLSDYMVARYLNKRTYYDIALHEDLDNPDQRIQENVEPVISTIANLPSQILTQVMGLITGGIIVASISKAMTWYVVGYSVLATVVTLLLYTPLIRLNFMNTVAEADFRYGLLHVRENAETVAFYRGEASEHEQIRGRLDTTVRRRLSIVNYLVVMSGVNQAMSQLWELSPFFLIAPLFFEGKIEYGAIAMAVTAASQMKGALTTLTTFIPTLAGAAPQAVRLAQILERFDQMDAARAKEDIAQIEVGSSPTVSMHGVNLETPGGEQTLVRNLDFQLGPGENLIIVGQTGIGKSSLLRAMAGMWRRGTGTMTMPPIEECLFLPQKPYMILADLRSQLLYPRARREHFEDVDLQRALDQVCLPHLLEKHGGLDAVRDWAKVLSLGEQQRIGFARVLISRPKYVFLDEATSAIDVETEGRLYGLISEIGASCISVGHRESILRFHDRALHLRPGGNWEILPAKDVLPPRETELGLAKSEPIHA